MTISPSEARKRPAGAPVELSARVMDAVRHGPDAGHYKNAERLRLAMFLSAIGRGYSLADIMRSLDIDSRFDWIANYVAKIRSRRGPGAARKWLLAGWEGAERRRGQQLGSKEDVIAYWSEVMHDLVLNRYPGKGGSAELALLMTIAQIGIADYEITPDVSRLDMEIVGGISRTAIEGAIKRSVEAGRLVRIGEYKRAYRAQWALQAAQIRAAASPIGGWFIGGVGGPNSNPRLAQSHAMWSGPDFGLGHWHVYLLLNFLRPGPPSQIAEVSGLHPTTVKERLGDLAEVGLATADPAKNWLSGPRQPADVAEDLGLVKIRDAKELRAIQRDASSKAWAEGRRAAIEYHRGYAQWRRELEAASVVANTKGGWTLTVVNTSYDAYKRFLAQDASHC